ncbi:prepilin-type N-terminal cleavage/methylation domain-containing protein, partial [Patescibacteria group bacterium]|nr:prepilin-type N-terminal cleavage/methylation domain-containing protein [Patescibacteria group bacterium]
MNKNDERGLSLIEILIVIAIIAILGTITFVAINPSKYAAESRDTERESEVIQILNKAHQYLADDKTISDLEAAAGTIGECGTADSNIGTSGVNLGAVLVSDYISEIPIDPSSGCNAGDTCYDICKNSSNGS